MPYLDRSNFDFPIVLLIINLFEVFSITKNIKQAKVKNICHFRMGRKRERDEDFLPDENVTAAQPRRSSRRKVSKTEPKVEPSLSLSDEENKPVRVASRGTSKYSKKARTTMIRGTVNIFTIR